MRGKHLAVGVAATVLALSLPSVALAARPGHDAATTTTLPTVPAKAEPLLKRLLKTAGMVTEDNLKAAALSERYDAEKIKSAEAQGQVAVLDGRVSSADGRLTVASLRLRQAAVTAYVTGELTEVNSGIVAGNVSVGEMANVYSSAALSQLRQALHHYRNASSSVHVDRSMAVANEVQIAHTLVSLAELKRQADALIKNAASEYASINTRLRRLVGRKEFARLFSPWPAGSPYRGPNLAGTEVSRVATGAQGLKAVVAAKKLLGVPYVFGGAGKGGVDCSGLTMLAWAAEGYSLPHSATLQWEDSSPVSLDHLKPGDLLFYHFAHDGPTAITHVVMYVGSGPYGAETVIQASAPGTNVALGRIDFSGLVSAGRP
jgi:cell wall-associated NlpC family hydrolase